MSGEGAAPGAEARTGPAAGGHASHVLEVLGVATRLGLTSFGGPIAHLGYFREEYVVRRKWLDEATYADLVALCQFLPGPASSQVGIAIGVARAGLLGGLAAWLGFTLPSAIALVAFAYGILVLPYAYRAIQANLDSIDVKTLSEAARSLGAGWGTVLFQVLVPNLRRGILAASFIAVAVVLGEFTVASLLNRVNLQTALLIVNKADPYIAVIFALLSLLFAFLLLVVIGRVGSVTRKVSS